MWGAGTCYGIGARTSHLQGPCSPFSSCRPAIPVLAAGAAPWPRSNGNGWEVQHRQAAFLPPATGSAGAGGHENSGRDEEQQDQVAQGSGQNPSGSPHPAPATQPRRPKGVAKDGRDKAIKQAGRPQQRAARKAAAPEGEASMQIKRPQEQLKRPQQPPQPNAARNRGGGAPPVAQQQQQQQQRSGEDEDEQDEEEEAAEFSLEEAERLIFGDKDFTQGGEAPVDAAMEAARSREALVAIGLSQQVVDLLLLLQSGDRAPRDPEGLRDKVQAATKVVGGVDGILPALDQLAAALSTVQGPAGSAATAAPGGEWQPSRGDAAAAMLQTPKVLAMPATAIQQRAGELEAFLKVSPRRARELCCSSPALLLVPKTLLQAKLKVLQQTTGLSAEVCASMVSVHMFPELRLG